MSNDIKTNNGSEVNTKENDFITVKNLVKYFPVRGGVLKRVVDYVQAVDDISFSVQKGETLGLVGESGCGKSVMTQSIMRLFLWSTVLWPRSYLVD